MTYRGYALAGGLGLVALAGSYAAGRFSAPAKTIEHTVTVEKTVRDEQAITAAVTAAKAEWAKEVQDHTVTRAIYSKAGKIQERIIYRDVETKASGETLNSAASSSTFASHEAAERTEDRTKIVEGARPRLSVGLTYPALRLDALSLRELGAEADVRTIGTLWIGLRYVPPPDGRGDWRDRIRVAAKLEF